ncbi:hypothetical protein F4804DRAFT_340512 [Jackrogersella minutella]|nr:hypothetical protein F4804DRAFT_340512 [Jackrogersella minutella]
MDSRVPTMDLRWFSPSEQLLSSRSRVPTGINRLNGNYRGDGTLPANTGANVPEESNTNLWITGLPGSITVAELLSYIKHTGRVRSTVINPPIDEIRYSAASISFFKRRDAEVLFRTIQQGRIVIEGITPRVQWNRNRVGEDDGPPYASRVLLIAGDPQVVDRSYLNGFFSSKFVYDIDCIIDHGTVPGYGGPIGRLEYRFGSWRSQAASARTALMLELRGFLLVEYGADPCAS